MKRIAFVLLGLFLISISFSQNYNLKVERIVSEYFIDTLYSQIEFCYSNNSDSTYILWIERDNVDSLSNSKKINKHFFTVKGDFSLMGLIYDGNVASFTPGLFDSFIKVIKPKEQFVVSFLNKGKADMNNSMEKQIVIVNANEIYGLQIDSLLEKFQYHAKSVTILVEWMK